MPSKHVARVADAPPQGANKEKVVDLLCQALQAEQGRAAVLDLALRSAQNEGLREHLVRSRARADARVQVLRRVFDELAIPADQATPGREVVRHLQDSLLAAMEDNLTGTALDAVQLIMADCVLVMEAKTDSCWRLIRAVAEVLAGERGKVLKAACARVDAGGDDLPTSAAWTHALWLKAIGLPASLPPAAGIAAGPPRGKAGRGVGSAPGALRSR